MAARRKTKPLPPPAPDPWAEFKGCRVIPEEEFFVRRPEMREWLEGMGSLGETAARAYREANQQICSHFARFGEPGNLGPALALFYGLVGKIEAAVAEKDGARVEALCKELGERTERWLAREAKGVSD